MFKRIVTLFLLVSGANPLPQSDCTYKAITNPEKGSYGACELTHASKDYSDYGLDTGEDSYGDAYRYEYTLCYGKIVLSSFLTSPIDSSTLALIDQHLWELKVAGVKPIVRIMYSTDIGEPDTTLDWVETHLQQLQPVFEKHSDIIAWFQGGIIGAWGEWHSSSSGLDTTANKVAVYELLHTYLPATPACLKIQVRYPMIMSSLVPTLVATYDDAFNDTTCTKAQRLGFHNDCWMSSWHDTGTYKYDNAYNQAAREYWLPYLENVTRYSPYGGETCIDTTTGNLWTEFTCSNIFKEAQQLHATFLNPHWHPNVTKHMRDNCCWEEFIDRSGYRFEVASALISSSTPSSSSLLSVPLGGTINYRLEIANTGWGSLYSRRRGYLSLFQYLARGDMHTISVDGAWEEEWKSISLSFEDDRDETTAAVADIRDVSVTNDADFIYILIRFYNVSDGNAPFSNGFYKMFFDTDNSATSGYSTGVSGGKIGSELLLEGQSLYDQRSGGYNDGAVVGGVTVMTSEDGMSVEIGISRYVQYSDDSSVFPFGVDSVTMVINVGDTSWNLVDFSPKIGAGYQYIYHKDVDVIARYDHDIGADLREWRAESGAAVIAGSMVLPSEFGVSQVVGGAKQENVTMGLWFPDPSSELQNNTRLNIQLGLTVSGGYWDSTLGVNMLPFQLNVTETEMFSRSCYLITSSFN